VYVKRTLLIEAFARFASVASLAVGQWLHAVDGFGKNARTSGFAYASWATKQISMCQMVLSNCVFQCCSQNTLTYNRLECLWAVFSCRDNVWFHVFLFIYDKVTTIFVNIKEAAGFVQKTRN